MFASTLQYSRKADGPNAALFPGQKRRRPVVLVVEDHDDTREMLHVLLEMRGCRVIEADNGVVALELARQTSPDLILMDNVMPGMDGLSACASIRQDRELCDVPIIVVSGDSRSDFRRDAMSAGCNECVTKPIDFVLFYSVLDRYLTPVVLKPILHDQEVLTTSVRSMSDEL